MKIAQVCAIVKQGLGHWFSSQGFRLLRPHSLAFEKRSINKRLVVLLQGNRWGWDPYQGGEFRFLVARYQHRNGLPDYEQAFQYFLNEDELETARKIQDSIISTLRPPPESYFATIASQLRGQDASLIADQLRRQFLPVSMPYRWHCDFFLRYYAEDHVRLWCAFLGPVLPRIVQGAEEGWVRKELSETQPSGKVGIELESAKGSPSATLLNPNGTLDKPTGGTSR